jgi:hypothetical protein
METIQEMTDGWLAAGKKKGLKMPVKGSETEEIFLSKVKMVCESAGVKLTESRQRITRNNGSGTVVTESDQEQRIRKHMERTRCIWKEASIFMTGSVVPEPTSDKKSLLAEAWHRYSKALTPAECQSLAARNVPVPTR